MIETGAWAVFGPVQSPVVSSISENLHIPHFQVNWDYRSFRRHKLSPSNMTINLHPEPSALSQAFADLVESRNWKSFALVYDVNEELIKLKDLLRVNSVKLLIRQLPSSIDGYRKMFKDIKKSGEINLVLAVGLEKVNDIMESAQEVGLMTDYNHYMIANLDLHHLDLSNFTHVNISGMSLHYHSLKKSLTLEEALLSDAVSLFARAVDDLERTRSVTSPSLTCESRAPWAYGSILMNIMKVVNVRGLTGPLKFDEFGRRSDFLLDIIELRKNGFRPTGVWDIRSRVNITRNYTEAEADVKEALRNKTLRVTVPTVSYSLFLLIQFVPVFVGLVCKSLG